MKRGPKAPIRAQRAPEQELEGGARSAPNFQNYIKLILILQNIQIKECISIVCILVYLICYLNAFSCCKSQVSTIFYILMAVLIDVKKIEKVRSRRSRNNLTIIVFHSSIVKYLLLRFNQSYLHSESGRKVWQQTSSFNSVYMYTQ